MSNKKTTPAPIVNGKTTAAQFAANLKEANEREERDRQNAQREKEAEEAREAEEAAKFEAEQQRKENEILEMVRANANQAPPTAPAVLAPTISAKGTKPFNEMSIAERLQQLERLNALTEKLDKLNDTRENLEKFVFKSDSTDDRLSVSSDSANVTFRTSQTHIIREVIELIKKRVDEMISSTENEIAL